MHEPSEMSRKETFLLWRTVRSHPSTVTSVSAVPPSSRSLIRSFAMALHRLLSGVPPCYISPTRRIIRSANSVTTHLRIVRNRASGTRARQRVPTQEPRVALRIMPAIR